ncbi:MAG: flagellar basal body P-ring formation protein FlgA [Phycisphaerales bacterium]|nr:flagellar basal body P-ring formation protein FlgA [Phycisphaerales bacterium]
MTRYATNLLLPLLALTLTPATFAPGFFTPAQARAARAESTAVVLKPAATLPRVAADTTNAQDLRLSDIAEVTGPDAHRLKNAVVLTSDDLAKADFSRGLAVELEQVREAISRIPGGISWGRVTLSGSTCLLRKADDLSNVPAGPPVPEFVPGRKQISQPAAEVSQTTLRGIIASRLAELQGVTLGDLRIKVASPTRADEAYLDVPMGSDQRVEITPGARNSSRMPLNVDVYQGDRLVENRQYTAEVQVRRWVVVPMGTIERDQIITEEDFKREQRWVSPAADAPADVTQVIGATPRRRLEAGRIITAQDLQSPVVVQKGETVWVHCLSGGFVIKTKARAMSAGRDGQLVAFQTEGNPLAPGARSTSFQNKKTFMARMSGRGVAVIELQPSTALESEQSPAELMVFQNKPNRADQAANPARTAPPSNPGMTPKVIITEDELNAGEKTVRGRSNQPRATGKR